MGAIQNAINSAMGTAAMAALSPKIGGYLKEGIQAHQAEKAEATAKEEAAKGQTSIYNSTINAASEGLNKPPKEMEKSHKSQEFAAKTGEDQPKYATNSVSEMAKISAESPGIGTTWSLETSRMAEANARAEAKRQSKINQNKAINWFMDFGDFDPNAEIDTKPGGDK